MGLMMAGTIPGVYSSSTRAELASVIAALPKPGGLYFALDNRAVVDGIVNILNGFTSRRPWALRPDGDLWSVAESAIAQRGRHSLRVRWTKGHATWWHIVGGYCTSRDVVCNGMSDIAADKGHQVTHRTDEQLIMSFLARGQRAYCKLIWRMQRYAIAIIKADSAERARREFVPRGKTALMQWIEAPPDPIIRPPCAQGARLSMLSLPRNLEGYLAEVSIFWQRTLWDPNGKPTTWLEIFALFRLWGGGKRGEDSDMHAPKLSFPNSLSRFINASKSFLRCNTTNEARQATQAYAGSELLLSRYGLLIRAPAVAASLCLDSAIGNIIHDMLITIRKGCNGSIGSNNVALKSSSTPLPKIEPWAKILALQWDLRDKSGATSIPKIMARNSSDMLNAITSKGQIGDGRDIRPNSFILYCPRCKAPKEASTCTLYTTQVKVLACAACSVSSSSSRWHCIHALCWMQCVACRELGFRCAGKAKRKLKLLRNEVVQRRILQRSRQLGPLGCTTNNSTSQPNMHKQK